MTTDHIFKPGDTSYTIWGEEVKLIDHVNPDWLQFDSTNMGRVIILPNGTKDGKQILYQEPVRVTPVSEFEEGEKIEVSDNEKDWDIAYFIHKLKSGQTRKR